MNNNSNVHSRVRGNPLKLYWIFTGMFLLASVPIFANGACIICPPGMDCASGTPVKETGAGALATVGDLAELNLTCPAPVCPTPTCNTSCPACPACNCGASNCNPPAYIGTTGCASGYTSVTLAGLHYNITGSSAPPSARFCIRN